MKNNLKGRGLMSAAFVVIAGMIATAPAAQASSVVVTLNTWNQQQFNTDGDAVTVTIDSDANTLTLSWISGNPGVPNAIGIDKFFFNGQLLSDPSYLASSPGWDLKGNSPHNAGGFPLTYLNEMDNSGGNQLSNVVFTFPGDGGGTTFDSDFISSSSFAAHVRYGATTSGGTCSGFASNQSISGDATANDAGCVPPVSTSEPSSLLMISVGIPIAAFFGKRLTCLSRN